MAGPRDRSRHRSIKSQNQYQLQGMHPLHLSPTDEGSIIHSEDLYDNRNRGHPHDLGAQYLDLRLFRVCKQRLDEFLETCKAQSARILRMCVGSMTTHWMMTLFITSVLCIFLLSAFRGRDPRAEPPGHGLNGDTGRATEHYHFPIIISRYRNTVYPTIDVVDDQFHGARPVHHQVPMAVTSDLELTGQTKGQHLLHLYVEKRTSSPVSGLYFMPVSITEGNWPQTQQESQPSSSPTTHVKGPQNLQGSQSSGKSEPQAELLLHYDKSCAPRNLSSDRTDADPTSFTRWGVDILYALHSYSRRSPHIYRESCIANACSPQEKLISMCNATEDISDSFKKQECEWCWPENQRKRLEIEKHCTDVSKHAFNAMIIICGIFLFCTVVVAIIMAPRMLHNMRMTKKDRMIDEYATIPSSPQKKTNSVSKSQFPHRISKISRSSDVAKNKIDGKANKNCSSDENNNSSNLWYKSIFAYSKHRSGVSPKDQVFGRSKLQRQRTEPLDQDSANGNSESHERVPVLPPAPSAISPRISSEVKNVGQGSLLSDAGTNSSQHNAQGMPLQFSKPPRAVSSGSEQNPSEPTHRRDAGCPDLYKLQ